MRCYHVCVRWCPVWGQVHRVRCYHVCVRVSSVEGQVHRVRCYHVCGRVSSAGAGPQSEVLPRVCEGCPARGQV